MTNPKNWIKGWCFGVIFAIAAPTDQKQQNVLLVFASLVLFILIISGWWASR